MTSPTWAIVAASALLALMFLSCETPIENIFPQSYQAQRELISRAARPSKAVSLAVGNEYFYNDWFRDSSGTGYDDGHMEFIAETTMLGGQIWYHFDEGQFRRTDSVRLYKYENSITVTELDCTLGAGDTFQYNASGNIEIPLPPGLVLRVISKQPQKLLGSREDVFQLVGYSVLDSTRYFLEFATRFGLISASSDNRAGVRKTSLVAAVVDGTVYGDTNSLHGGWSLRR